MHARGFTAGKGDTGKRLQYGGMDDNSKIFERGPPNFDGDISALEPPKSAMLRDGEFMLPPIFHDRSALVGAKLITEDIDMVGG